MYNRGKGHSLKCGTQETPTLIRYAGDRAIDAYSSFLGHAAWKPGTRRNYRQSVRRFLSWAEARELTLATVTAADVAEYAEEVSLAKSPHVAGVYLTPVRGLFRRLVDAGVLVENPFDPQVASASPATSIDPSKPGAAPEQLSATSNDRRFPLLDLMAMLANIEESSLRRIFDEDGIAEKLLEFVRWRDGRRCTHCGAGVDQAGESDEQRSDYHCPTCSRPYRVTDGSPFEASPVPLRHGLFLLFTIYLSDDPKPGDEVLACERSLDASALLTLAFRFQEALAREGLSAGAELRQAVARRNRELTQDEVVRDITDYGNLTRARDELIRAKAEGSPVADLPPGVSLEEALAEIEVRIAELDRYVVAMEDGYLVSRLADPALSGEPNHAPASANGPSDGAQESHVAG